MSQVKADDQTPMPADYL